jgi:uncharacterized protein (TIGR02594 family)
MYDAQSGSFYSTDPMNQTYSPYSYAGGNSVSNVDVSGKVYQGYNEFQYSQWLSYLETSRWLTDPFPGRGIYFDGIYFGSEKEYRGVSLDALLSSGFVRYHVSGEESRGSQFRTTLSYMNVYAWTHTTLAGNSMQAIFTQVGRIAVVGVIPQSQGGDSRSGTPWMDIAKQEIGEAERPGRGEENQRIQEYHNSTRERNQSERAPWCSSFANWALAGANIKGMGSSVALSWYSWGQTLSGPAYGSIAIFEREGGGHVGFVAGRNENGDIVILGGNQGNAVGYAAVGADVAIRYVYPAGYDPSYSLPVINTYKCLHSTR